VTKKSRGGVVMRSLKKELKNMTKTDLKKAILLKEILGKPKALDNRLIKHQ
jgi:hypothetical protein